jgi:hypothetical protein
MFFSKGEIYSQLRLLDHYAISEQVLDLVG